MTDAIGAQPAASSRAAPTRDSAPRVRAARSEDVPAVAAAMESLLVELGGERPPHEEVEAATRALVEDPSLGALFVAESEDGEIVGACAASWQHAVHVPGRYGTVQDLWVHPEWRSRAVGRELLEALFALAREQGVPRVEVGLPQDSFAAIDATRRFYLSNGFKPLGPRMRWLA